MYLCRWLVAPSTWSAAASRPVSCSRSALFGPSFVCYFYEFEYKPYPPTHTKRIRHRPDDRGAWRDLHHDLVRDSKPSPRRKRLRGRRQHLRRWSVPQPYSQTRERSFAFFNPSCTFRYNAGGVHIYMACDIRYVCPIASFTGAGAYLVSAGTYIVSCTTICQCSHSLTMI